MGGVSVCVFMCVCVCLFVCFSLWMDLMFVGRNAMCSHYLHIESNISNNDVIMIINSILWSRGGSRVMVELGVIYT